MKEDYLWDKTGTDPEIEKLENALAVFRYKETAPPALPAKILPFEKKEAPRSFIRYAFAAAACAAFVAISLGVLLQISKNNSAILAEIEVPQFIDKSTDEIKIPVETTKSEIENPKETAKPKIIKIKKAVSPVQNKTFAARRVKAVSKPVELTKEEKYAYDQLMLALSITSSKLKIVKDKIENIENQNAVITKER